MCIFELVSILLIRQISKISKLHFPENSYHLPTGSVRWILQFYCVEIKTLHLQQEITLGIVVHKWQKSTKMHLGPTKPFLKKKT